jgi:hypothetical protein
VRIPFQFVSIVCSYCWKSPPRLQHPREQGQFRFRMNFEVFSGGIRPERSLVLVAREQKLQGC